MLVKHFTTKNSKFDLYKDFSTVYGKMFLKVVSDKEVRHFNCKVHFYQQCIKSNFIIEPL